MGQPWPEPAGSHLPVRIRINVWNGEFCRADGALLCWLDAHAGWHGYALTPAGIRGRNVFYVLLPTLGLAQLMLRDFAGQVMVDVANCLAAAEESEAERPWICRTRK